MPVGKGQENITKRVVWFHLNYCMRFTDSFIKLSCDVIVSCEFYVKDQRGRINLQRSFMLCFGLFKATFRYQKFSIPLMSCRIVWIEFQRSLEFSFRPSKIPIIEGQCITKRRVGFG